MNAPIEVFVVLFNVGRYVKGVVRKECEYNFKRVCVGDLFEVFIYTVINPICSLVAMRLYASIYNIGGTICFH